MSKMLTLWALNVSPLFGIQPVHSAFAQLASRGARNRWQAAAGEAELINIISSINIINSSCALLRFVVFGTSISEIVWIAKAGLI